MSVMDGQTEPRLASALAMHAQNLKPLKLLLKSDVNKMAKIYISGTAAIAADILTIAEIKQGILIKLHE